MKRLNYLISILYFLFFIPPLYATKASTSWIIFRKLQSPKPKPLTAVCAIRGDLSGVIYNPSVLATINQNELFTLGEMGFGEDNFAGVIYGHPFKLGSAVSIGIVSYDAGSTEILWLDRDGNEISEKFSVQKDLLTTLSYARSLSKALHSGITLKFASSKLADEKEAIAVATDLGVMYLPEGNLTLSAGLQNFGTATKFIDKAEKLPSSVWLGAGYIYNLPKALKGSYFVISADLPYILDDAKLTPTVGLEIGKSPLSAFFGYRLNIAESVFSFGLTLNMKSFDMSYGYTPATYLNPTHRISFGFRFGPQLLPTVPVKKLPEMIEKKPVMPEVKEEVPKLEKVKPVEKKPEPVKKRELIEEEKLILKKHYWAEGMKYYQEGKYQEAIVEFEKILQLDPEH
ncbi:MAG: tetratricopeptide repeat protein, partial [Elusimicrobiota bacterium]|nr:tetratricopeptide repeat protein [Elusimicrobiota bacterium]